jgi:hypothetical protein
VSLKSLFLASRNLVLHADAPGKAALTVPQPLCYFAPELNGYELFP